MGVRPLPKAERVKANKGLLLAISGLVREFFDMLGDGEASPKQELVLYRCFCQQPCLYLEQVQMRRVESLVSFSLSKN